MDKERKLEEEILSSFERGEWQPSPKNNFECSGFCHRRWLGLDFRGGALGFALFGVIVGVVLLLIIFGTLKDETKL